MQTMPDVNQLESIFSNAQLVPTERFYRRMKNAAWTPAGITRRRAYQMAGAALALLLAFIFLTPQGRSLAQSVTQSFLGYFKTTDQKIFPAPPTPKAVPTYIIQPALQPFQPRITPAADIVLCGPAVSLLTSTFLCQMINTQAEVGYEIKAFGRSDQPLQFESIGGNASVVTIWYVNNQDSESYCFRQGIGDLPSGCFPYGAVPADSVQQVKVGNRPAELVVGAYSTGRTVVTWSPYSPFIELRWREEAHWYSISGFRFYWPGDSGSVKAIRAALEEKLLGFGENLVLLSAGSAKMGGGVNQTPEERLGFHILTPVALPQNFELGDVSYDNWGSKLKGTVSVSYYFSDKGQDAGSINFTEGPAADTYLDFATYFIDPSLWPPEPLAIDLTVQIGKFNGRYMVKPDGSTALVWEQDGVKLMLQPSYASSYGGRFTKAELIAIAESLK